MKTFKLEVGQKIELIDHEHMIERSSVDFSNNIGTVKSKDDKNVIIQLEKFYDFLKEWDNCLVFDVDDENHVDINCEFIDEDDDKKYQRLVKYLNGKKFFIVRWSGDACNHKEVFDENCGCHVSYRVSEPIKFFTEYVYDVETIENMLDLDIGEKFNVDEPIQDIEIMRVQ